MSSGVSRNKRVKGGKWQVTSAALSCLSPVGLIAELSGAQFNASHNQDDSPKCCARGGFLVMVHK